MRSKVISSLHQSEPPSALSFPVGRARSDGVDLPTLELLPTPQRASGASSGASQTSPSIPNASVGLQEPLNGKPSNL